MLVGYCTIILVRCQVNFDHRFHRLVTDWPQPKTITTKDAKGTKIWLIGEWLIGEWLIGEWLIGEWLTGWFSCGSQRRNALKKKELCKLLLKKAHRKREVGGL